MGRFSAPDDDHRSNNPDDQAAGAVEPMEISDDENENMTNTDDDDVMMLARMQLNDNTADENDVIGTASDSTSTSQEMMIAYNNNASLSATEMMEHDDDRPLHHDTIMTNNNNNNNAALLQMTQHCLQQLQLSNDYNHFHQIQLSNKHEQQRRRRQRNKKIIVSTIMMASIVTVVLKWHAPPPPPVVKQNSILTLLNSKNYYLMHDASSSSSVGESSSLSSNSNVSSDLTITHHETWGEYTSHIVQLTSAAILYTASVFWYAISNSFRYAALDVRDSIVEVMSDCWNGYRQVLSSSSTTTRNDDGGNNNNVIQVNRERVACPIRLQAAYNRHTLLPRGVANNNNDDDDDDARIMEGFSTEESLRQQLLMSSLPSQNIALQIIAQGIDSWGESMVEDTTYSVEVLHRMASFMTRRMGGRTDSACASSTYSVVQHEFSSHDTDGGDKDTVALEWILPPAKGFLFVGPQGVGKLYVAQHLAGWFFAHCNGNSSKSSAQSCSTDDDVDDEDNPVLEIIAGDTVAGVEGGDEVSRRRSIIEHIQQRKGLGSVIIIHHIEHLNDKGLLSDIVQVLNGDANTIPYADDDNDDEEKMNEVVSCDGTVFLLTSEQWGTKRMLQVIQRNDGLRNLPREGLLSGIRWEVDSHFQYWQRLNSHTTIVPFLPFQQDDLLLVMQTWFQELSDKYQGIRWARLDVSTSALEYTVGVDQVDYLDLYNGGLLQPTKTKYGDKSQQPLSKALLTFSTNGAHMLHENSLYTALKSKLKSSSTSRRPYRAAFLDVDEDTLDYILSWCDPAYTDLSECEIHWRLPLTFA